MADPAPNKTAAWISLLVVGISLNSMGLILASIGAFRWVLVGIGLFMLIVAFVGLVMSQKK